MLIDRGGVEIFAWTMDTRWRLPLLMLLLPLMTSSVVGIPVPAPHFSNLYEEYTNKTIDQLITTSLGGTNEASNQILDFGENILAELDMFLTKDQFLKMYQPPKPEDMIEMDIMPAPLGTKYDPKRKNFFADEHSDRQKRKAARDTTLRWTDATMPYKFARQHFEPKEEYMMRRAMTEWERYTCMRFRPSVDSDKNSVQFQNGFGCNSQLGMVGGVQMLNLQAPGCRFKGLYLHEVGHALGLVHEHQLPDRDQHIRILYHNVSPHMRIWFNKYTTNQVDQKNVPYQLSSVMHYGITAFSKDGKSQTIEALDPNKEETIGRVYLKELAYTDVMIVNKMYGCADHCPDRTKCGPRGHMDQNCKCICEDGSSDCDRTKRTRDDNCVNSYDSWSCYIWANQGECERNSFYMKKFCTKACHACGSESSQQGSCKDVHKEDKCRMWKGRGDCITNRGWMKRNCKATCGLCQEEQMTCDDKHDDKEKCLKWAREGECIVNANWMFKNCRATCRLCDEDGVDTGSTGGGGGGDEDKMACKDTHKNCQIWAESGECQNNPDWMINNCRKACDKCDDGKCKSLYDDTKCEIWQQKMECLSNAKWMSKNCAKQCKTGACQDEGGSKVTDTPVKTTKATTSKSGGTVTSTPTCKNLHSSDKQCQMWADNDHCSINPSWMTRYCAKACGVCTDSSGKVTTAKTPKTTSSSGGKMIPTCTDTNTQCAAWSKAGYCDSHPRYNLLHCKKSCNNCNGCRDQEILCQVWADAGHCSKNPRFMLRQCQKSCKACFYNSTAIKHKPQVTTTPGHNSSLARLTSFWYFWLTAAVILHAIVSL